MVKHHAKVLAHACADVGSRLLLAAFHDYRLLKILSYIVFKAVSIPLENHVTSSFVSVLVHLLHTKNHNVLHSLPCHAAHHNKHATLTGTISLSLQSTWTFGAPVQTSLSQQNLHTLWFRSRVIIKACNLLQCHESGFGSAPLNLITKCIKYDP